MAGTRRQRDHTETDALNNETQPARVIAPQDQSHQQQQRDRKSSEINHGKRSGHNRTRNLTRVWQTKRSQHAKRCGRYHGAKEKRRAKPGSKQYQSRNVNQSHQSLLTVESSAERSRVELTLSGRVHLTATTALNQVATDIHRDPAT